MENNEVVQLYLDDIIPNRFQPREVFNDQALKELAISIREHGVIQPIIVRKFGEKYEIIAGERRYKASTMAGLTKIPAIVKNYDDKEASKVALIENLQRRDLTPIEEARTYQKILDLDSMSQEELAKTMGKSQSAVSNKLRLLSLPDEVQESLLKEEISERHARSLLNVSDKNKQIELLHEVINNKMPVRELEQKIKELNGTGSSNNDNETSSDNEANGGVNNNLSNDVDSKPVNNDIPPVNQEFQPIDIDNISVPNTTETPVDNSTVDNNQTDNIQTNNLFTPTDEVKPEVSNMGENNMNNNSLFGAMPNPDDLNGIPETNNEFFNNNIENDPTVVDINKIKEQSTDINFAPNPLNTKPTVDPQELVRPSSNVEEANNRFIPDFEDTTKIEKTEDGNEVIGNGLLAGMPVIKPVDNNGINNTNSENSNNNSQSNLFTSDITSNNPNNLFSNDINSSSNQDSLFSNNVSNDTNQNSLFVDNSFNNEPITPRESQAVENRPNESLFNIPSDNPTKNVDEVITSVKENIQMYIEKGYNISTEQIDLDNEVQLIIKINKN